MIDKNIQPDYSIKEEKLRLHAALPLLAPAIATAIGAAIGLTGTGLVLQKKIQNYFANNPGALDSIVSKFGTKPGDQPEVEEELKELTKPTTTPIKTWEKSFADTGTKVPEKLPEPKGIEVPPQEKVSPPGFQKAEPLGIDILTKDIADETVPKESEDKIKNKITTWEDHFPTIEEATKAVKDVGATLKEFEEGVLQKKITFKKWGKGGFFKVLYDGKEIAELAPLEGKNQGLKEYNIKFIGDMSTADTGTGLAETKELVKKRIVDGLLDKSEPSPAPDYWQPLRKTFEEATFDKEGNYVEFTEPAYTEKEKIDKYFEGIDELYDNEWYGSAKSIRDFIDNTTVDEDDIVYDKQKSIYQSYGMEKPIHEFFENEYKGGVGNLGNKDAAAVMQMGDLSTLGGFVGPQYYQEYMDKLHGYTLNTLGKEFKVYRLSRKDEMESFLNPDRPDEATDPKSFSLSKDKALAFKDLWHDLFTTKEGKPRKDLVLIETTVPYDSLIMRGHSGEHEIVVNGEFLSGDEMNFYDLKGNLIKGADKELKKATGGLIDKPLTGRSRDI